MTDVVVARLAAALSDRGRVDRELGQGGMATVYLAHGTVTHEMIAGELAKAIVVHNGAAALGAARRR